ncbi:hypothetical protein D3C85_859710 [compost metagenome]
MYGNPAKLRLVTSEELGKYDLCSTTCLDSNYIGAAYHHGHHVIRDCNSAMYTVGSKKYGIRNLTPPFFINPANPIGTRIIESHLLNSTTTYKHNIIRDFFHQEKEILVYDRYMKEATLCLLETLLRQASPLANITIISEFEAHSVFTSSDVYARIKKVRPTSTVKCLYPNFSEQSDKHDRHIHLGSRLQITFSSGLDCFGLAPDWNNSECDIHVYYLDSYSRRRRYAVKNKLTDKKGSYVEVYSKI